MAKVLCESVLSTFSRLVTRNISAHQLAHQRCALQTTSVVQDHHKYLNDGLDLSKYTLKPQRLLKSGGRDIETGKVVFKRVGGGHKQRFRMVDTQQCPPKDHKGEKYHQKVLKIAYDPLRTAHLALVGSGNRKRYIVASEYMKKGDIVTTHTKIPKYPVSPVAGDTYPVGSLPTGTLVHNIERYTGDGAKVARAAGSAGMVIRRVGQQCIIRMPSKREMMVAEDAMATVGRVSNVGQADEIMGSAGRSRWHGIRPARGFKQKKTGYNGRNPKKPKAMITYSKISSPESNHFKQDNTGV